LKPESATVKPVTGESPYMGLRYFDTSDADLFFGREALTAELLKRVKNETFLAIVGASGSGKSSVARAGLIPVWKKENERGIIHIITPTTHPLESLASSLTRDSESVTATSTLMDDMNRDVRSLRLYVKKTLGEAKLLLLVDQFEETFTLCKDIDERKAFIENLLSLADENGSTRVVITLRADFYHHCLEFEGLRLTLEKHQANLGAMTQDELREAILKPAETNGWDFQPGLVDLILQDIGTEPGALPLLSHALLETWKRRQGHTLTLQGYHNAGGVKKAITQTAENVYDKLSKEEQGIARNIFLRLTELGEGTQDTRRRVKMDELAQSKEQGSAAKVLKTLADARLLTTEEDSAEVAHEALIREWGTLRKWLDEDRESLRTHRHLTESAGEWQRRGKEASELYRGARLKQLQDWAKKHGKSLSPLEIEFLQASKSASTQELVRWFTLAGISIILLIGVILAQLGYFSRLMYQPIDMSNNYWVTIPAGEFQMGSENGQPTERPIHSIYLDSFQIGKFEITNNQYNQCIRAKICSGQLVTEKLNHPVINVNWYEAEMYCSWVNGRLPTEAEWEKAASWDTESQTKRTYPWGEIPDCSYANYYGKGVRSDVCVGDTTSVGSYETGKSPYGVYDMAGNVWEWTNDWYDEDYYQNSPASNPQGADTGEYRVLRGGSWDASPDVVRSTNRFFYTPANTFSLVGFRCARTP
ncbi:MAG: SUMF1/EgtB/PvdO family nonheme iron enzyme, partial [Anaerolineae bacterium]|nr:SUMF1/EgtB/PvdO family nonheme iron enzyme [Anaerolineae bacterium]